MKKCRTLALGCFGAGEGAYATLRLLGFAERTRGRMRYLKMACREHFVRVLPGINGALRESPVPGHFRGRYLAGCAFSCNIFLKASAIMPFFMSSSMLLLVM